MFWVSHVLLYFFLAKNALKKLLDNDVLKFLKAKTVFKTSTSQWCFDQLNYLLILLLSQRPATHLCGRWTVQVSKRAVTIFCFFTEKYFFKFIFLEITLMAIYYHNTTSLLSKTSK